MVTGTTACCVRCRMRGSRKLRVGERRHAGAQKINEGAAAPSLCLADGPSYLLFAAAPFGMPTVGISRRHRKAKTREYT